MISKLVRKFMQRNGKLEVPTGDFNKSIQELEDMAKKLAAKDKELEDHYALVEAENNILKKITEGATMYDVLYDIVQTIESFGRSSVASILIYTDGKLWNYCSPNLSDEYTRMLRDGFPIGPNNGSCGAAAWHKQPYFVDDITIHPNWTAYPELLEKAQDMGIVSCYSTPILGAGGILLGTVAIYCMEMITCKNIHTRLLEWSARIAAIMIEKDNTLLKLHEHSEQLRGILESQRDLIIRFGTDKKVSYANQAYKEVFDITDKDIKERSFEYITLVHPEDRKKLNCTMKDFLKSPPYRGTCELRALTKDGYRWFEWQAWAVFDKEDNVEAIQASGRDITDRVEKEELLAQHAVVIEEKNKLLKAIIDSAGSYLWFKDQNHSYRFVDRGFKRDFFLDLDDDVILGRDDISIISDIRKTVKLRHDYGELCISSDEHSRKQRAQCRYIEGGYIDDRLVILEVVKTPLFDDCGRYTGNIGAAWDRSEELESILADKGVLQAQGRLEVLSKREYPETPFIWWIKPKGTHYRDVSTLPLSEEASILEQRLEESPLQPINI